MVPTNWDDTSRDPGISREQLSDGSAGVHNGLHARYISAFAVLRIRGRSLYIPTKPEVQSQPRKNSIIILYEDGREPTVGQCTDRRILRDIVWDAEQKVRQRVTGNFRSNSAVGCRASVKAKCPVVIEQGVLNILLKCTFSPELECVLSTCVAKRVS